MSLLSPMDYEHRVNGWWLYVITMLSYLAGLLVGWLFL